MLRIMLKEPVGGGTLPGTQDVAARSSMYIEAEGTINQEFLETMNDLDKRWFIFAVRGHSNRVAIPVDNISYIMEMA